MVNDILISHAETIDIIGDLHGCYSEMMSLLEKLDYRMNEEGLISHPKGRIPVLVGDLTDRGPKPVEVLRFVMRNLRKGRLMTVLGNHDDKIKRALKGNKVQLRDEILPTIESIRRQGKDFIANVINFIDTLPVEIYFERIATRVVHGAVPESDKNVSQQHRRSLALYGKTTGRNLEDGRPERLDWAKNYSGQDAVVYGHNIVEELGWINNTIDIDLGCFRTGRLCAVRMPEREIVILHEWK